MTGEKEIEARSKVFWEGALKTRAVTRGFEVETDKPKQSYGTNTAAAPMEVFISSMGSCFMTTFTWAVQRYNIRIEDVTVDVKGVALEGGEEEKVVSGSMKLTVWAKEEHREKLQKCFEHAKKNCTLTNAVNFPLDVEFVFKEG